MRDPLSAEEFATLAQVPLEDIERFRDAGLLDPETDGLFDEFDALRLSYILMLVEEGKTVDDIVRGIKDDTLDIPYVGDLLFGRGVLFRGNSKTYTLEEAAEATGLTPDKIEALRTTAGLPGRNLLQQVDVEMMAGTSAILAGGMPWEAIIDMSRVYGDALRRIAEAEMRMVHEHVHVPLIAAGVPEREMARQSHQLIESLTDVIDPLVRFIHHQHLLRQVMADVLRHFESPAAAARHGFETTIMFVDLTSYTSLSQVHGDEVAAQVLDRFDGLVRSLVHRHQGTLIKQIGDAFMLTFGDAADAVRFALDLEDAAGREEHFPALRIGIHAGPVLFRVGDYVGNTVNIASRIAAAAMPNEIVLTEPVANAAAAAGLQVGSVGMRMLRGIEEPLGLYRAARRRDEPANDPVCGMKILGDPAARLTWEGVEYAFCSQDCLQRFAAEPGRYAKVAAR
jgi:class 3 adenylate cyclase